MHEQDDQIGRGDLKHEPEDQGARGGGGGGGASSFARGQEDEEEEDDDINIELVAGAFGAKERTKHGDYSAFEHPLERRANEAKQNDCKVGTRAHVDVFWTEAQACVLCVCAYNTHTLDRV